MNEIEKKILWQCRRGLWELDAILIPFFEETFKELDKREIEDFRKLLSYEDIEIFDILVNKKSFDDRDLEGIVDRIKMFQNQSLEG